MEVTIDLLKSIQINCLIIVREDKVKLLERGSINYITPNLLLI